MNVVVDDAVIDFIDSLEPSARAKAYRMLLLLEEFGHELGMPHSRSLGHGIFELRIRGKQEARLLYGFLRDAAHVVHGFVKKSQQTPKHDITLATRRLNIH